MDFLVPQPSTGDWEAQLASLERLSPLQPFAAESINFIEAFSGRILTDARMRSFPELMALAHWMRTPRMQTIERHFNVERNGAVVLARGVVLHFAPSNVDSIFIYSWFLSLLMGNLNIVRLSTAHGEQLNELVAAVNAVLARPEFAVIRERTLVLSFEHDDAITRSLSARCHVRVLWGGDESIARLRQIPLPPLATEIAFADRFSFSVLNAARVLEQTGQDFCQLIRHFFADAFWFDQMACSSPRMVVWIGAPSDVAAAKQRFWPAVKAYMAERSTGLTTAADGITRLATVYTYAAEGEIDAILSPPAEPPARVHLDSNAQRFREMHCGRGVFLEREYGRLDELLPLLAPKDQTMSVFGFSRSEVRDFVRALPARTIDRIVEVGRSLTFSHVWDGVDLLRVFSRQIDIGVP